MTAQRYPALDIFRGMTICFMIIVNTAGGDPTFAPLMHAKWHGFTPTDLVFPSFLFAVGNAMSFVMLKWAQWPNAKVVTKILKRTLLIFLLGYLMYWFPFFKASETGGLELRPISSTRIFGVLQRIALCYGIAVLMIHFMKPRWVIALAAFGLILYKWLLGQFGDMTLEGNAVLKLDLFLFGPNHLYHGEGMAFDPEGLLSTLPAISNVVAGYFVGRFVQQKGKSYEGLTYLLLAGFALLTIAYFWDSSFPINKKLWTSTFVLYTVGLDLIILATIIFAVDFKNIQTGRYFFEVFGKNPLFIYLLSEVGVTILWLIPVGDKALYNTLYENVFIYAGPYWASLSFALWWMFTCWLVGWWMDRKGWYVRV